MLDTKHSQAAQRIDFLDWLRADDLVVFGQGCSEPTTLLRRLLEQGESLQRSLGKVRLFVTGSYSGLIQPGHSDYFDFLSYGAFGICSTLAGTGHLGLYPVLYSRLPTLLGTELKADVVLLQLSAPDARNRYSLGIANDFQLDVARRARVVIAEVNRQVPFSPSALVPDDLRIDHMIWTDEAPVEVPAPVPDEMSMRIAAHVAPLIPDGATLQMGMGSLMSAICQALSEHRDLGVHGGILTDGLAELMRQGVVTNALKGSHVGKSVVGSLLGSRRLFEFAHNNEDVCLVSTDVTHGQAWLSRQRRFCSINSAVEIDLTGQVNAEVANGKYVGAVGGQPEYVRAAAQSEGGLSVIALPSTAARGKVSRIVSQLSGPVTTARSDIDCVVTEWGAARLRGLTLRQRALAMVGVAHPSHRDDLLAAASAMLG